MSISIYHNPRCSKSRQTLQALTDKGITPKIIDYIKTPPSYEELDNILNLLGIEPRELIRKTESIYKALNLSNTNLDRQVLIQAMVENPILIERPIVVVANQKAAIGRPPENVLAIL